MDVLINGTKYTREDSVEHLKERVELLESMLMRWASIQQNLDKMLADAQALMPGPSDDAGVYPPRAAKPKPRRSSGSHRPLFQALSAKPARDLCAIRDIEKTLGSRREVHKLIKAGKIKTHKEELGYGAIRD